MRVFGIDPAPVKATQICTEEAGFVKLAPGELAGYLREQIDSCAEVLIAWDAPLSFEPSRGFHDRPIDAEVRRALQNHDRIVSKAVNVRPFAGCPHWAISMHVLGHPPGPGKLGLDLVGEPRGGRQLVEVHPAVALAVWWLKLDCSGRLPRYKGINAADRRAALSTIADALALLEPPDEVRDDDDCLDAWVAWRLGRDFLAGEATLVGTVEGGGYVLPVGARELLGLRGV